MSDTHSPDPQPVDAATASDSLETGDVASMEDILSSIRSMIAEEETEPVITQYEVTSNIGTEVARARSAVRDRIRSGQGHLYRNDPIPVIPPGARIDDTLESARARADEAAQVTSSAAVVQIPPAPPSEPVAPPVLEDFDLAAELGAMELGGVEAVEPIHVETPDTTPAFPDAQTVDIIDSDLVGASGDTAVDIFDTIDFSAPIDISGGESLVVEDAPAEEVVVDIPTEVEAVPVDAPTEDLTNEGLGDLDIGALLDTPVVPMPSGDAASEQVASDGEFEAPESDLQDDLEDIGDLDGTDALPVNFAQTEDMDLVKSLMAELTEGGEENAVAEELVVHDEAPEELHAEDAGALELDDNWLESELAIPELESSTGEAGMSGSGTSDSGRADDPLTVFDEIVEQAISDEEQIDAVARAEDLQDRDTASLVPAGLAAAGGGAAIVSLADIARRAEADAASLGQEGRPVPPVQTLTDMEAPELHAPEVDALDEAEAEVGVEVDPAVADAASLSQEGRPVPPVETLTDMEYVDTTVDIPEIAPEEAHSVEILSLDDDDPEAEPNPEPTPEQREALETEIMARNAALEEIITDDAESDVSSTFAELNRLVEEKTTFEERGPRIGDLVSEALKPMLKEWLDENLKGIVERAVSKEVKRIASGK